MQEVKSAFDWSIAVQFGINLHSWYVALQYILLNTYMVRDTLTMYHDNVLSEITVGINKTFPYRSCTTIIVR